MYQGGLSLSSLTRQVFDFDLTIYFGMWTFVKVLSQISSCFDCPDMLCFVTFSFTMTYHSPVSYRVCPVFLVKLTMLCFPSFLCLSGERQLRLSERLMAS